MTARIFRHRTGELVLGARTLIMGIVNVTPDSFSDGGDYFDTNSAIAHAKKLVSEGADIIDLGAESTRPGSETVSASEQIRRLQSVLAALPAKLGVPISVDTTRAEVADMALKNGASIINDVSGFHDDRELPKVCANYKCGVVLMHRPAPAKTMQQHTNYANLLSEIRFYLQEGIGAAHVCDIAPDHILVDPGLGFGKTFEQNYQIFASLKEFSDLAAGVLVGPSRKNFTAEFSDKPAAERQFGTAAAVALSVTNGADVVRVHDVAEMKEVVNIVDRFRQINEC